MSLVSLYEVITIEINLYFEYKIFLRWRKSQGKYSIYADLITTGLWKQMIFELIIVLFTPYPFFELEPYLIPADG